MASEDKKFIVITTINEPTEAVIKFAGLQDWKLVVVADKKTPSKFEVDNLEFLSLQKQQELGLKYYQSCPYNHYSRKNLGYLYVLMQGGDLLAETDDDNIPNKGWGEDISFETSGIDVLAGAKYVNAYKWFTDKRIWPRGFPLENILQDSEVAASNKPAEIGVWQYLADNEPDVDAIYRLVIGKQLVFDKNEPIALDENVYCPFNSQNTFWNKKAFPYLYLPTTVTFRFTDILRGYIAQRLLWEEGMLMGFGQATVWQDRNYHNLMHDFVDEIPVYKDVIKLVEILDGLNLSGSRVDKLQTTYEALFKSDIVKKEELNGVALWARDVEELTNE